MIFLLIYLLLFFLIIIHHSYIIHIVENIKIREKRKESFIIFPSRTGVNILVFSLFMLKIFIFSKLLIHMDKYNFFIY